MKRERKIIIAFLVVLSILTATCVSGYAARTTTKANERNTTLVDSSESSSDTSSSAEGESSEDTGTTAADETTTTTKKPSFEPHNGKTDPSRNRTTTKKGETGTDTSSSSSSADSSNTSETIRGTTGDGNQTTRGNITTATGVIVDYNRTTYRNDPVVITQAPTYTTTPTVIAEDASDNSESSSAEDTTNGLEIYTIYGESTQVNSVVEITTGETEPEKKEFHFNFKILIALLIVLLIGIITAAVFLFKKNKEFRSSLYFQFKK